MTRELVPARFCVALRRRKEKRRIGESGKEKGERRKKIITNYPQHFESTKCAHSTGYALPPVLGLFQSVKTHVSNPPFLSGSTKIDVMSIRERSGNPTKRSSVPQGCC